MIRAIALLILVSLTGIAAAQEKYKVNTLGANDAVPNVLIENLVDESTASALLETTYKGFIKMGAR